MTIPDRMGSDAFWNDLDSNLYHMCWYHLTLDEELGSIYYVPRRPPFKDLPQAYATDVDSAVRNYWDLGLEGAW